MQNVTHVRIVLDVVAVLQTYKSKKAFSVDFQTFVVIFLDYFYKLDAENNHE